MSGQRGGDIKAAVAAIAVAVVLAAIPKNVRLTFVSEDR